MKRFLPILLIGASLTAGADRASDMARDEAKVMVKEGWRQMPGELPLELSLADAYAKMLQTDAQGNRVYLTGVGQAVGTSVDAAKFTALTTAKADLSAQLHTALSSRLDLSMSNRQVDAVTAESVTKALTEATERVEWPTGRLIKMMEVHRRLANGSYEVMIRMGYSVGEAEKSVRKMVQTSVGKDSGELASLIDDLMGW